MLDGSIYEALTQLSRKLKHRNISQTANDVFRQFFTMNIKNVVHKKATNSIDALNEKYGIPKDPNELVK